MTLPFLVGVLATLVSALLCILAIVRLWRHQNASARRLATSSMLATVLFIPAVAVAAMTSAFSPHPDDSKATVLARGIAEGLNAGGVSLLAGFGALIIWFVSVRRMRREANRETS